LVRSVPKREALEEQRSGLRLVVGVFARVGEVLAWGLEALALVVSCHDRDPSCGHGHGHGPSCHRGHCGDILGLEQAQARA